MTTQAQEPAGTPLTDAERFTAYVQDSIMRRLPCEVVHATCAEKLERDLARLRSENAGLVAALDGLDALMDFSELPDHEPFTMEFEDTSAIIEAFNAARTALAASGR